METEAAASTVEPAAEVNAMGLAGTVNAVKSVGGDGSYDEEGGVSVKLRAISNKGRNGSMTGEGSVPGAETEARHDDPFTEVVAVKGELGQLNFPSVRKIGHNFEEMQTN